MSSNLTNRIAVRLRLVGQMEAWTASGENILPPGHRTRGLLAAIALSAPRPVSRRWLAELLWSLRPNEPGRTLLRLEVRRLSDALAPAGKGLLVATRDSLALRPGAVWIDALEIMRATASAPGSLSLLDGALLEGLDGVDPAFDIWLKREREHLHDRARAVAEANLLAQNESGAVILAARRLLFIDPAHEGGWRALMRAYAEQGDHGMAMRAYERCRAVLSTLLDARPSAEMRRLLAEISGPETVRPNEPPPERLSEPEFAAARPEPLADATPPTSEHTRGHTSGHVPRNWPHVGVLPMRGIGLTAEETFLGPTLAHEITSALSRFYRVIVTASDSLARFARGNRDETAIRRTFGIDYLLDGTIQREGDRLRVLPRLIDLRAGNRVVWAERFDRTANDLKAVLNEIAAETVARIEPELQLLEALRTPVRPLADLSANDLRLLTIPLMTRMDREGFMRAGEYLERAIALEPNFCDAHTRYAFWHVLLVSQGWAPEPRQALTRGGELAERGVALNPLAARALTIAGLLRSHLGRCLSEAAALYDRALEVNPNLGMTWALLAVTRANMGDIDEAERRYHTYKTLLPHARLAFVFDAFFAPIHLIKRDYQAAIAAGQALVLLNPAFSAGYKPHLAALGHLRHHQEAASVSRRLLAVEPNFTIRRFLDTTPMRCQADREHFVEGLQLAGVP